MAADTTNGAFSGLLVNARLYNDAGVRIDSVIRAPLANAGAGAFNAGNAGAPGTIILAYGSLFKNNNLSPLIEKLHFNVELFPTNNYAGRKTFDLYYKIGTLPDAANNYAGCAKVNSTTACSAALDLSTCQGTPPVLTYATTYTVNGGTAVAGSSFTATASGSYTVAFMFDNGTCTKMLNKTLTCTVGTESVQAFGKPMTVYPNPATDVLYFAPDASISELQIWDMTGKLVSAQRTTFAEEMATSTATLSKGMYQLITLDAAGNRLNYARFVKQ